MNCRISEWDVYWEVTSGAQIPAVWGHSHTNELQVLQRVFRRVRKIAKSDYYLRHVCLSVCLSVCPHGANRLPLDGFSRNLISEYFSNICWENSSFPKIWEEKRVLNVKTSLCFVSYLTRFLSELEMIQRIVAEKIKTYFILNDLSPLPKIVPFII